MGVQGGNKRRELQIAFFAEHRKSHVERRRKDGIASSVLDNLGQILQGPMASAESVRDSVVGALVSMGQVRRTEELWGKRRLRRAKLCGPLGDARAAQPWAVGRRGGRGALLVAARTGGRVRSASPGGAVWMENFMSGATASTLTKLVLQPFDTTKTILQASRQVRGSYRNLAECAAGIVRQGGFLGLYAGFLASIAVSAPSSAIFFSTYEFVKKGVENACDRPGLAQLKPLANYAPIVGAIVGNMVASSVRVPPEVLKQRVQAGMYRNMVDAVRTMWAAEGIGGFYRGYSTMLARDIPYAAIQFMAFETLKRRHAAALRKKNGEEGAAKLTPSQHVLNNLWMGAVAGGLASTMTLPLDVVKTRIMTQGGVSLGMRQTIMRIWAEEGIVAFGRGLVPRVLYKVPGSAVFLVCYEAMKRLLRTTRKAREVHERRRVASPSDIMEDHTPIPLHQRNSKALARIRSKEPSGPLVWKKPKPASSSTPNPQQGGGESPSVGSGANNSPMH